MIHPDMICGGGGGYILHFLPNINVSGLRFLAIPAVFFLVRFLIFRTEVVILSHGSHLEVMRSHDLPKESRVKINGSNLLYSQSTQDSSTIVWCTYGCFMIQIWSSVLYLNEGFLLTLPPTSRFIQSILQTIGENFRFDKVFQFTAECTMQLQEGPLHICLNESWFQSPPKHDYFIFRIILLELE